MVKTCKSGGIFGVAIHRRFSGERVRNTQAICLLVENSPAKVGVILHRAPSGITWTLKLGTARPGAKREAYGLSGSWRGNGPPSLRRVAGLRERSATLELRYGPDTYGWQQFRIIPNGRKPEGAIPRGG